MDVKTLFRHAVDVGGRSVCLTADAAEAVARTVRDPCDAHPPPARRVMVSPVGFEPTLSEV